MAKRNRRSSKRTHGSKGGASGIKWIFFGILLGALGMYLVWQTNPHSTTVATTATHKTAKLAQKQPLNSPHAIKPKPSAEYDFYTMLPQMQVKTVENTAPPKKPAIVAIPPATPLEVSAEAIEQAQNATVNRQANKAAPIVNEAKASESVAPTAAVGKNERYIVQVANVSDFATADRVKAELTMQGFDVSTEGRKINGRMWIQVLAGSFASKQEAIQLQKRLKQNHIGSILVTE